MRKALPSTPGVYLITNTKTGNLYVGSSVNLRHRWDFHKYQLRRNIHHNSRLQRAWNKYGEESFEVTILQLVENREDVLSAEQAHLDERDVANNRLYYNFLGFAGSNLGYKFSEESKRKISQSQKGKVITPEARVKMRAAKLGRKLSLEHRAKLSEVRRGKRIRPKTEQEKAVWRKLTPEQVREIRLLRDQGWSTPRLARHFQTGRATIRRILAGEAYQSIK